MDRKTVIEEKWDNAREMDRNMGIPMDSGAAMSKESFLHS